MKSKLALIITLTALAVTLPNATASPESDRVQLEQILRSFLAGTAQKAVHDAFWAEDLIYTSSDGTRRGKAAILAGFDDRSNSATMNRSYGAEEVAIRVLGDIGVVTFRLTADEDDMRVGEYFNTGVFHREGDGWRAFTWQATRIP